MWERVRERLEALLAEWEPRTTAKPRLTGVRMLRALQEEGCQVGRTVIYEYLRERRRQRAEVFVPLIHRAGDEAQVDFFEVTVELGGEWVKGWKFLLRADVLGARIRVAVPALRQTRLSRRPRGRLCLFRRDSASLRLRQSAGAGASYPGALQGTQAGGARRRTQRDSVEYQAPSTLTRARELISAITVR